MDQCPTTSPCGVSEQTVNSSDLLVALSALEAEIRPLKTIVIVFCVLGWLAATAWADEVMLKNGDRLSGDILKMGELPAPEIAQGQRRREERHEATTKEAAIPMRNLHHAQTSERPLPEVLHLLALSLSHKEAMNLRIANAILVLKTTYAGEVKIEQTDHLYIIGVSYVLPE